MNPIDAYITRKLTGWVLVSLVCASFLFFATQAFRLAPLFMGADVSGSLLLAFIWVQVPILGWALGPAVVVAVFAVAGAMAQRGEFLAADSVGITRFRLGRWPLLLTIILCIVSIWIWVLAAPQSQRRLQEFVKVSLASAVVGSILPGQFVEPIEGVVLFARQKIGPGEFRKVTMKRTENGKTQVLVASGAKIHFEKGTPFISILLSDGNLFYVGKRMSVLHFEELQFQLSIYKEVKTKMAFLPDTMTISTTALWEKVNTEVADNAYSFELFRRLAKPLEFLLMALISVSLAFGILWKKRGVAFGGAILVFAVVHLLTRGAEVWMTRGDLAPNVAAFFSSIAMGAGICAYCVWKFVKKRLNSL